MSGPVECLAGKIFYLLLLSSLISLLLWGHTGCAGANLITKHKYHISLSSSQDKAAKKGTALPVLPACLCIYLSLLFFFKSQANSESRCVLEKVLMNEKSCAFQLSLPGLRHCKGDANSAVRQKMILLQLAAASLDPRFLHCPSCEMKIIKNMLICGRSSYFHSR